MQLQIAQVVVGDPDLGDELVVTFEDDRLIVLKFKPHTLFDHYQWRATGKPPYVRSELKKLAGRGIEMDDVRCYADHSDGIIVGQLLRLVLVPNGNMSDWPRFTSRRRIKQIEIN